MAEVRTGKKKVWFGSNPNSDTGIKNAVDKNVSVAPGKFTKAFVGSKATLAEPRALPDVNW